jgi:hypothetical protein
VALSYALKVKVAMQLLDKIKKYLFTVFIFFQDQAAMV